MRQKLHEVREKKKERPLVISKEFLLKAERSARREVAIESGTYRRTGAGVHGGNNNARNRRDRREARQEIRRANEN